ncbi:FadR/GntR family transcriptional regulator, partial [Aphanothece microscopica]|uniref:FadR/GntR family transcriptional regulator n=1 Tax=Aphanothece microscopica TaxID=1049561 RepID=UPI003984852F
ARATPEQISRLKRLLLDLEDSGTQLDQRVPADIALHSAIAEMSGNTFLHGILQSMTSVLSEERRYGGEIRQAMGSVHADSDHRHEDLVSAIEHHDEVAAEEAARGIVLAARESFIRGD